MCVYVEVNWEYLRRLHNIKRLLHVYAFTRVALAIFAVGLCQLVFCCSWFAEIIDLNERAHWNIFMFIIVACSILVLFQIQDLSNIHECALELWLGLYVCTLIESQNRSFLGRYWDLADCQAPEAFIIHEG